MPAKINNILNIVNGKRVLSIGSSLDSDCEIEIVVNDSFAESNIWINESQALKIVEHLEKVFGLERNSKTQESII